MEILQQDIIKIVYSAITGEKQALSPDFDINAAAKIAKNHAIMPMFYYGALNCGVDNSLNAMQGLFMSTCQYISLTQQQIHSTNEIFSAFQKNGIDYMPLKGTLLRDMYPKTEMRSMCDADILIKTEQYDKIKPVMQELGFTETVESDHELIWKRKLVTIELHKRLMPSYNKDYYAYFGDGWQLGKAKDGTRYSMTDEDQMVYLFTHFAKHYRDGGIGIRHIVDLWVYRKNKPDLDEDYIKAQLEALMLYEFYVNILKTLSVWFDGQESDATTDFITSFIFSSGIYGTKEAHLFSQAVRLSKKAGSAKGVKLRKMWKLTFLPYNAMRKKYPVLEKAPILLPVMWVIRIFSVILFKSEKVKQQNQVMNKITDEGIDSYQQSLSFVGLDFNFKE